MRFHNVICNKSKNFEYGFRAANPLVIFGKLWCPLTNFIIIFFHHITQEDFGKLRDAKAKPLYQLLSPTVEEIRGSEAS